MDSHILPNLSLPTIKKQLKDLRAQYTAYKKDLDEKSALDKAKAQKLPESAETADKTEPAKPVVDVLEDITLESIDDIADVHLAIACLKRMLTAILALNSSAPLTGELYEELADYTAADDLRKMLVSAPELVQDVYLGYADVPEYRRECQEAILSYNLFDFLDSQRDKINTLCGKTDPSKQEVATKIGEQEVATKIGEIDAQLHDPIYSPARLRNFTVTEYQQYVDQTGAQIIQDMFAVQQELYQIQSRYQLPEAMVGNDAGLELTKNSYEVSGFLATIQKRQYWHAKSYYGQVVLPALVALNEAIEDAKNQGKLVTKEGCDDFLKKIQSQFYYNTLQNHGWDISVGYAKGGRAVIAINRNKKPSPSPEQSLRIFELQKILERLDAQLGALKRPYSDMMNDARKAFLSLNHSRLTLQQYSDATELEPGNFLGLHTLINKAEKAGLDIIRDTIVEYTCELEKSKQSQDILRTLLTRVQHMDSREDLLQIFKEMLDIIKASSVYQHDKSQTISQINKYLESTSDMLAWPTGAYHNTRSECIDLIKEYLDEESARQRVQENYLLDLRGLVENSERELKKLQKDLWLLQISLTNKMEDRAALLSGRLEGFDASVLSAHTLLEISNQITAIGLSNILDRLPADEDITDAQKIDDLEEFECRRLLISSRVSWCVKKQFYQKIREFNLNSGRDVNFNLLPVPDREPFTRDCPAFVGNPLIFLEAALIGDKQFLEDYGVIYDEGLLSITERRLAILRSDFYNLLSDHPINIKSGLTKEMKSQLLAHFCTGTQKAACIQLYIQDIENRGEEFEIGSLPGLADALREYPKHNTKVLYQRYLESREVATKHFIPMLVEKANSDEEDPALMLSAQDAQHLTILIELAKVFHDDVFAQHLRDNAIGRLLSVRQAYVDAHKPLLQSLTHGTPNKAPIKQVLNDFFRNLRQQFYTLDAMGFGPQDFAWLDFFRGLTVTSESTVQALIDSGQIERSLGTETYHQKIFYDPIRVLIDALQGQEGLDPLADTTSYQALQDLSLADKYRICELCKDICMAVYNYSAFRQFAERAEEGSEVKRIMDMLTIQHSALLDDIEAIRTLILNSIDEDLKTELEKADFSILFSDEESGLAGYARSIQDGLSKFDDRIEHLESELVISHTDMRTLRQAAQDLRTMGYDFNPDRYGSNIHGFSTGWVDFGSNIHVFFTEWVDFLKRSKTLAYDDRNGSIISGLFSKYSSIFARLTNLIEHPRYSSEPTDLTNQLITSIQKQKKEDYAAVREYVEAVKSLFVRIKRREDSSDDIQIQQRLDLLKINCIPVSVKDLITDLEQYFHQTRQSDDDNTVQTEDEDVFALSNLLYKANPKIHLQNIQLRLDRYEDMLQQLQAEIDNLDSYIKASEKLAEFALTEQHKQYIIASRLALEDKQSLLSSSLIDIHDKIDDIDDIDDIKEGLKSFIQLSPTKKLEILKKPYVTPEDRAKVLRALKTGAALDNQKKWQEYFGIYFGDGDLAELEQTLAVILDADEVSIETYDDYIGPMSELFPKDADVLYSDGHQARYQKIREFIGKLIEKRFRRGQAEATRVQSELGLQSVLSLLPLTASPRNPDDADTPDINIQYVKSVNDEVANNVRLESLPDAEAQVFVQQLDTIQYDVATGHYQKTITHDDGSKETVSDADLMVLMPDMQDLMSYYENHSVVEDAEASSSLGSSAAHSLIITRVNKLIAHKWRPMIGEMRHQIESLKLFEGSETLKGWEDLLTACDQEIRDLESNESFKELGWEPKAFADLYTQLDTSMSLRKHDIQQYIQAQKDALSESVTAIQEKWSDVVQSRVNNLFAHPMSAEALFKTDTVDALRRHFEGSINLPDTVAIRLLAKYLFVAVKERVTSAETETFDQDAASKRLFQELAPEEFEGLTAIKDLATALGMRPADLQAYCTQLFVDSTSQEKSANRAGFKQFFAEYMSERVIDKYTLDGRIRKFRDDAPSVDTFALKELDDEIQAFLKQAWLQSWEMAELGQLVNGREEWVSQYEELLKLRADLIVQSGIDAKEIPAFKPKYKSFYSGMYTVQTAGRANPVVNHHSKKTLTIKNLRHYVALYDQLICRFRFVLGFLQYQSYKLARQVSKTLIASAQIQTNTGIAKIAHRHVLQFKHSRDALEALNLRPHRAP